MQVICLNCNKEFKKLESEVRKHPNHYCSRSCSAIRNNKISPKRSFIERICRKCFCKYTPTKRKRSKILCSSCSLNSKEFYKSLTIGEYQNSLSVKDKHPSWKSSMIRNFNRSWNKELAKLPCAKCGYSKHVELAHLKPITAFSLESTLGEVNSPLNVIQLCPNCHWEFDNLT